jgi:hypothetical protein
MDGPASVSLHHLNMAFLLGLGNGTMLRMRQVSDYTKNDRVLFKRSRPVILSKRLVYRAAFTLYFEGVLNGASDASSG